MSVVEWIINNIMQVWLVIMSVIVFGFLIFRDRRLDSLVSELDNQTDPAWLELPNVVNNHQAHGTIAYLSQDGRKVYFGDITYSNALIKAREENAFAFAWIPHEVALESEIKLVECNARCVNRCVHPGCLCHRGVGRCK